jgi:hypothetical protein
MSVRSIKSANLDYGDGSALGALGKFLDILCLEEIS